MLLFGFPRERAKKRDESQGEKRGGGHWRVSFVIICYYLTFIRGSLRFSQISPLIIDNGGRIVDLDDLKLTHILVARKDQTRRLELIKRTSQ